VRSNSFDDTACLISDATETNAGIDDRRLKGFPHKEIPSSVR